MLCIVDNRISEKMKRTLALHGIYSVELPSHTRLGAAIASHPDTLIFKLGKSLVTSADYLDEALCVFTDIREMSTDTVIIAAPDTLDNRYPCDCAYNALVVGNRVFLKIESASDTVLNLIRASGKKVVCVKQGYAACSTLVLGENAAITADKGMSEALRKEGVRVYEIASGNIALPPHEYGFIGGACGVFGNKVFFFGDYKKHPSSDIIEQALRTEGFIPISLSDEELVDLGGIVFLD